MYKNLDFSLWCDFIERDFIGGEFAGLINSGAISGATSNPSIFKEAICNSPSYNEQKRALESLDNKSLYEALATTDIRLAAHKMLPVFVASNGKDGFISLEVDPDLCDDSKATYKEGKRLFNAIKMPNVMIKVPATERGLKAMSRLIKSGISVNATLIFSSDQAAKCLDAFAKGLAAFSVRWPGVPLPQAVISIFVSRFDRLLTDRLSAAGLDANRYGTYNATNIYRQIEAAGMPSVRALFASTGVKGGELAADYYITELLYPRAINTAPLPAIRAFKANAKATSFKEPPSQDEIDRYFAAATAAGIDHQNVCDALLDDGLKAFCKAFDETLNSLL